jgi:predicted enzyme related to lactoylglutathione lyase
MGTPKLLGLRSLIYHTVDLESSKKWWVQTLGYEPYFDQPFYVGFDIGGYELGFVPDAIVQNGPTTYWGVDDIESAFTDFTDKGAQVVSGIEDVGEKIKMAVLRSGEGELFGLIFNPHFKG